MIFFISYIVRNESEQSSSTELEFVLTADQKKKLAESGKKLNFKISPEVYDLDDNVDQENELDDSLSDENDGNDSDEFFATSGFNRSIEKQIKIKGRTRGRGTKRGKIKTRGGGRGGGRSKIKIKKESILKKRLDFKDDDNDNEMIDITNVSKEQVMFFHYHYNMKILISQCSRFVVQ